MAESDNYHNLVQALATDEFDIGDTEVTVGLNTYRIFIDIFAAKSKFFENIRDSEIEEDKEIRIKKPKCIFLPQLTPEIFSIVYLYIMTGVALTDYILDNHIHIIDLAIAAKKLQMGSLLNMCVLTVATAEEVYFDYKKVIFSRGEELSNDCIEILEIIVYKDISGDFIFNDEYLSLPILVLALYFNNKDVFDGEKFELFLKYMNSYNHGQIMELKSKIDVSFMGTEYFIKNIINARAIFTEDEVKKILHTYMIKTLNGHIERTTKIPYKNSIDFNKLNVSSLLDNIKPEDFVPFDQLPGHFNMMFSPNIVE